MITVLNLAVDAVEAQLASDPSVSVDVAELAARTGTTEHHLRRMFASLAGMPLSEYVRRRRMSLAAADLVSASDDLLTTAVRFGYGSTEAFGRAFRAVHGASDRDFVVSVPAVAAAPGTRDRRDARLRRSGRDGDLRPVAAGRACLGI